MPHELLPRALLGGRVRLGGYKLPLERLSATSISTFMSCPEQFRQKYILKQPESLRDDRFIGSVAHSSLHKLFDGSDADHVVDEAWREILDKEGEPEWVKVDAAEAYRRCKLMIKTYWPVASETKPVAVEQHFEEKILGVTVQGYIDLELDDRIREVKTSSQKQSKPKPRHTLQGRLYSLVSSKPVEWHYVTRQTAPKIYTPEECPDLLQRFSSDTTIVLLKQVLTYMSDTWQRYGASECWPLTGTMGDWTCGYCSFRKGCAAHAAIG